MFNFVKGLMLKLTSFDQDRSHSIIDNRGITDDYFAQIRTFIHLELLFYY